MGIFELTETREGQLLFLHYKFGKRKSRGLAAIVLQPARNGSWMHVLVGEEILHVRYSAVNRSDSHLYELCNAKGQYLSAIDSIEVLEDACK